MRTMPLVVLRPYEPNSTRAFSRPAAAHRGLQILAGGQGGNSVGTTGASKGASGLPPAHSRAASPAKTHKFTGQNGMCAFLGVKGSRIASSGVPAFPVLTCLTGPQSADWGCSF